MRYVYIFLLLLLFGAPELLAQDCVYKQALELYEQENYSAAIAEFDTVLENPLSCPDVPSANVRYWRAWSYYQLGQTQQAMDDFTQAEASNDYGLTAKYMRIRIARTQNPEDQQFLQQSIDELNGLVAHPNIQTNLKDKALLFRNLMRLQLGEILYKQNNMESSTRYFQGIQADLDSITNRNMSEINALIRTNALAWMVHEILSQEQELEEQIVNRVRNTQLARSEDEQLQQLTSYHQSLMHLFVYLLQNDYEHFVTAKNEMMTLDTSEKFVQNYKATIDLLEKNYQAVINASLPGESFDDFRKAWAYFLRNQESNDLRQAENLFKSSRDALVKCQSPLRKASAFRYMQARHFRDWQAGIFADQQLSTYFSSECLDSETYVEQQEIWTDIFEEGYGYMPGNCQTGRGYLELGLYKSNPGLVEKGKNQLLSNNCELIQDDLYRAILLCIGQEPNFARAIEILSGLLQNNTANKDEVKYALAMAYYNNNQLENAIPLLDDLAKKGSLDASYKLASIYTDLGQNQQACQYLSAILKRPNVYTIYRNDANRLYTLNGCSAFGDVAVSMPAESQIQLDNPEYNVFAYDYIGDGVGIISKLFFEMKSEIVKFITPQVPLNFYDLDMLEPSPLLKAYINLTVRTPLATEPELTIRVDNNQLPNVVMQQKQDEYTYESGALDMGDFDITISQKGSFGWTYENFISGNFERTITLDSAFVLEKSETISAPTVERIAQVNFDDSGLTAFSPYAVESNGIHYPLPQTFGVVSFAVQVDNVFYCLHSETAKVTKVTINPADTSVMVDDFIRNLYDVEAAAKDAAKSTKPIDISFNPGENLFYILNSNGIVFEFNRQGDFVAAIDSPSPSAFVVDLEMDTHDNCLWFLDIAAHAIHKYDLATRNYNVYEKKALETDLLPLSLLLDAYYFYLTTVDGFVHLHKKTNFRKLQTFSLSDLEEGAGYVTYALTGRGLNSKKLVALKKQTSDLTIRPTDVVEVFQSRFDEDFEVGK